MAAPRRRLASAPESQERQDLLARAGRAAPIAEDARGEVELPDSVELYLNEIARFKLLTPQEEVDLFKKIEHGRVLSRLSELHMAETGAPPTNDELTYLLLREMAYCLQLIEDSSAIRGFPHGHRDQIRPPPG